MREPGEYGCQPYPKYRPKWKKIIKSKTNPRFKISKKSYFKPTQSKVLVNNPSRKSQHFKHKTRRKERTIPENQYYKRNKEPITYKCWNCEQIEYKSIDCIKRKATFVKLYVEEFKEISEELYSTDIENFNEVSSYYGSIGYRSTE